MSKTVFDNLPDYYEAMIDWPKRLINEGALYRQWFEKRNVRSVIDVACGTGRHAAMFHGWGLKVEGADISPAMIARAKEFFGEDDRLWWVVRGFDQPIESNNSKSDKPFQPFDAAICTGNSLALAPDEEIVKNAIRQMFAVVRSGGLVIIQVLNLWHLPEGPCVWQKCKKVNIGKQISGPKESMENDSLILKGVHRTGNKGYVDFLIVSPTDGKLLHHESVMFLGLELAMLEQTANQFGVKTIHFFGNYRQENYDREKSVDLIMIAEKE